MFKTRGLTAPKCRDQQPHSVEVPTADPSAALQLDESKTATAISVALIGCGWRCLPTPSFVSIYSSGNLRIRQKTYCRTRLSPMD